MTPLGCFVATMAFAVGALVCVALDNLVLAGLNTALCIVSLLFLIASGDSEPPT